jgi:hypothetical protein
VTITATSLTDTTKIATGTVAIALPVQPPPPAPIAVTVSPSTVYAQTSGTSRTARFVATVANDTAAAGVDWKLSCGGSACGQIAAHTASGAAVSFVGPSTVPAGGTVTLTATSTTDPTRSATAIATIVTTPPIVVTMSSTPLPAALTTGAQVSLAATVASDLGNLGVNWSASCASAGACGSFNLTPAHTASGAQIVYTAPSAIPAGGVVTITASSPASAPSNPATATTTIVAQPPSIAFLQAPPTSLVSATKASVSAIVTNDVAPGGVTWSVQCNSTVAGGCGWIAPAQSASGATVIYTAPPVSVSGTAVTIVATSTASPQASVQPKSPTTIMPVTNPTSVGFIPSAPSQMQANATVSLNAAVANDATNAGVDWQVCASGCGFFTTQPAIAAIPATTTTPYVPAVPAVTATTVMAWPSGRLLPFTAPSQPPASGSVVVLAAAHANPATANSATIAITANASGPALHGTVVSGTQPVAGASVALYAAGTSGYASAAAEIVPPGGPSTATTDANGNFVVASGYSCPQSDSQMYLVASGGHVGANAANPNLALMTALGGCGSLTSTPVVLNEVTTVASAFALAPFASNDALNGNSSYLYLGTGSGNAVGLANAFAAVNNLVDIGSGQVRFTVPAGNASVPYVEIDTLADMLHACVASAGGVEGDGSVCDLLFTATDVLQNHTLYNSSAPADTLQAIFNIAQHPVTNYGYQLDGTNLLFGLVTAASPFQPTLAQKPNDWSLSLNYTGGGGLSASSTVGSFAIDSTGDLWITDTKAGTVIEWNAVGAALSPSTGFTAGGGPIAIDATGNVWISGNGSLTELTSLGTPIPGSPFGGVPSGGADMSFDAQSNLWITTGSGVAEFNGLGIELSPSTGYGNNGVIGTTAVGIDSSNDVWVGGGGGAAGAFFAELTNPGGELIVSPLNNGVGVVQPQIAPDAAGNVWFTQSNDNVCVVAPYGGKGTYYIPTCYVGGGTSFSSVGLTYGANFQNPGGIAFDGAGTLWLASQGNTSSGSTLAPGILPIVPAFTSIGTPPTYLASQSLGAGAIRLMVDGSGNVWVLLANNTVTEYVGLATPVVTPLALGVKNKKLAARP